MVHEPDPHLNTSRYRYELWIHDGWPIHVDVGIPTRRRNRSPGPVDLLAPGVSLLPTTTRCLTSRHLVTTYSTTRDSTLIAARAVTRDLRRLQEIFHVANLAADDAVSSLFPRREDHALHAHMLEDSQTTDARL